MQGGRLQGLLGPLACGLRASLCVTCGPELPTVPSLPPHHGFSPLVPSACAQKDPVPGLTLCCHPLKFSILSDPRALRMWQPRRWEGGDTPALTAGGAPAAAVAGDFTRPRARARTALRRESLREAAVPSVRGGNLKRSCQDGLRSAFGKPAAGPRGRWRRQWSGLSHRGRFR